MNSCLKLQCFCLLYLGYVFLRYFNVCRPWGLVLKTEREKIFCFKKQNKKVERKDLVITRKTSSFFFSTFTRYYNPNSKEIPGSFSHTNTILFVTDGNIVSIMDLQALPRIVFIYSYTTYIRNNYFCILTFWSLKTNYPSYF